MRTLCSLDIKGQVDIQSEASFKVTWPVWTNHRPVLMPEMSACVYIVQWLQGPDTTVKLPHDTQKGQPKNAIPKISMFSLLSITAQLSSMHQSRIIFILFLFWMIIFIIDYYINDYWTPPTGVLARVTQRAYRPSTGSGPVASKYYCEFLWTVRSNYQIKCTPIKLINQVYLLILEHEWTSIGLTSSHLNTQGRVFTLLLDSWPQYFN